MDILDYFISQNKIRLQYKEYSFKINSDGTYHSDRIGYFMDNINKKQVNELIKLLIGKDLNILFPANSWFFVSFSDNSKFYVDNKIKLYSIDHNGNITKYNNCEKFDHILSEYEANKFMVREDGQKYARIKITPPKEILYSLFDNKEYRRWIDEQLLYSREMVWIQYSDRSTTVYFREILKR